jgi:hypothetical protein
MNKEPNFCENCAMDLVTCDCVVKRPAYVETATDPDCLRLAQPEDEAKLQESIDWLKNAQKNAISRAITDDVLVQLFYAAQGDITQFRIKARAIIEAAGANTPFDSPEGA